MPNDMLHAIIYYNTRLTIKLAYYEHARNQLAMKLVSFSSIERDRFLFLIALSFFSHFPCGYIDADQRLGPRLQLEKDAHW